MSIYTEKVRKFFVENELKFVLVVGFILIAVVSFESGYLKGKSVQTSPIIVEKPAVTVNLSAEGTQGGSTSEAQKADQEAKISPIGSTIPVSNLLTGKQDCAFVGSKNSNKYHLPTCRYAKLIKPENIVCFSSAEDATAKNYLPDKGCIK